MKNKHYKRAGKLLRKIKKQRKPDNNIINQTITEVASGMKDTLPKYKILSNGMLINIHDIKI